MAYSNALFNQICNMKYGLFSQMHIRMKKQDVERHITTCSSSNLPSLCVHDWYSQINSSEQSEKRSLLNSGTYCQFRRVMALLNSGTLFNRSDAYWRQSRSNFTARTMKSKSSLNFRDTAAFHPDSSPKNSAPIS